MRGCCPTRAQEGIVTAGDLLHQNVNAFVIELRETTKKCVEDTTRNPHVDTIGIMVVLDDLRSRVSNSPVRCHRLFVLEGLAETKVGGFDLADAAALNAWNKLTLIFFLFVEL